MKKKNKEMMKAGVWEVVEEEGNRSQGEESKREKKKSQGFFLCVCPLPGLQVERAATQRKWRRGTDCEYLQKVSKT